MTTSSPTPVAPAAAGPPSPADASLADVSLACPACGYDLRAMAGDRCPECGQAIDRAALRVSSVPWAHRRRLGRVRAYVATVRQFVWDARSLRQEAAKPQDPRDGATFHRVTGALLSGGLLLHLAAWLYFVGGLGGDALLLPWQRVYPNTGPPPWLLDVLVPWWAGATLPPVLPVARVGLAFHLAGVQRTVFRGPASPADEPNEPVRLARRQSAVALASYASAPLVFLAAAAVVQAAVFVRLRVEAAGRAGGAVVDDPFTVAGDVAAGLLALAGVGGTLARVGTWLDRATHGGPAAVARGLGELLLLWAVGAAVWLGALPWCVGLAWVLIDSLW